jgi:hypothetical protein
MAELETIATDAKDCCSAETQQTCCEPEAKSECCGGAPGEGCGCAVIAPSA